MKRLMLCMTCFMVIAAMGQERKDTTVNVGNRKVEIMLDDLETNVRVFDRTGNELVKSKETTFVDGQEVEHVYVSSPFMRFWKKDTHTFHAMFPDIYMGVNSLGGGNAMHRHDTRSSEWGFYICKMGIGLNNIKTLGIAVAAQIGFVHNHFDKGYVLDNVKGENLVRPNEGVENVKTSFLKYQFFRLPVMLQWEKNPSDRPLYFGAGLSMELRGNEKSRYRADGKKHTVTDEVNMNPIGLNLEAAAGISGFSLLFHYGLTKLFKNGPVCHPFFVGIGWTI